MDIENTFIKPVLKSYFEKGLEEYETYKEISDKYGKRVITMRTINKWFKKFRINKIRSANLANVSRQKFTDEYLIDLVNDNPDLNMSELAKLANTAPSTISTRLKQVNSKGERAKYISKNTFCQNFYSCKRQKKFTDEFLIELVKKHPNYSLKQLAAHADVSLTTMANRMKQVNGNSDRVKYISKKCHKGQTKFTDKCLIDLINKNPELNMKELAKLLNSSPSHISIRIKQINSDSEKVKYITKSRFSKDKVSDEYLLELISDNPNLNMSELANLAGISDKTMSRRIQQINDSSDSTVYIKKDGSTKKMKFTDEYLINLINENPKLNMRELSNLAGTSVSTISKRLKKINSSGEKVKYINKF